MKRRRSNFVCGCLRFRMALLRRISNCGWIHSNCGWNKKNEWSKHGLENWIKLRMKASFKNETLEIVNMAVRSTFFTNFKLRNRRLRQQHRLHLDDWHCYRYCHSQNVPMQIWLMTGQVHSSAISGYGNTKTLIIMVPHELCWPSTVLLLLLKRHVSWCRSRSLWPIPEIRVLGLLPDTWSTEEARCCVCRVCCCPDVRVLWWHRLVFWR